MNLGPFIPDIGRPLARPLGWSGATASPCSHGEERLPRARTSLSVTELSLIQKGRASLAGPHRGDGIWGSGEREQISGGVPARESGMGCEGWSSGPVAEMRTSCTSPSPTNGAGSGHEEGRR